MGDTSHESRTKWLDSLMQEMLQTERSAVEHTRKEADRLGPGAPFDALRAIAAHADRSLEQLAPLANEEEGQSLGETVGRIFSVVRDGFVDRLVTEEKSYRGTVLGLHHGVGCAILTHAVAEAVGRNDLVQFLDRWLDERRPLVSRCEREIAWFATHVSVARD